MMRDSGLIQLLTSDRPLADLPNMAPTRAHTAPSTPLALPNPIRSAAEVMAFGNN
jgi:hypothetical protein